jgi:hypothetical protein
MADDAEGAAAFDLFLKFTAQFFYYLLWWIRQKKRAGDPALVNCKFIID